MALNSFLPPAVFVQGGAGELEMTCSALRAAPQRPCHMYFPTHACGNAVACSSTMPIFGIPPTPVRRCARIRSLVHHKRNGAVLCACQPGDTCRLLGAEGSGQAGCCASPAPHDCALIACLELVQCRNIVRSVCTCTIHHTCVQPVHVQAAAAVKRLQCLCDDSGTYCRVAIAAFTVAVLADPTGSTGCCTTTGLQLKTDYTA
jgi:hypothetical protein